MYEENDEIDVIIEIPYKSNVKYEIDNNDLRIDRVLSTAMFYPGNYGYIPRTLAGDGDPVDVLIINETPFYPTSHIRCKVLGMLFTTDEKGEDQKVLALPINKIDSSYSDINDLNDINDSTLELIKNFYENYKKLEKNKTVTVKEYFNKADTIKFIKSCIIEK